MYLVLVMVLLPMTVGCTQQFRSLMCDLTGGQWTYVRDEYGDIVGRCDRDGDAEPDAAAGDEEPADGESDQGSGGEKPADRPEAEPEEAGQDESVGVVESGEEDSAGEPSAESDEVNPAEEPSAETEEENRAEESSAETEEDSEESEEEPQPEGTSESRGIIEIKDAVLGVSARGWDHYAYGSTAARGGSDPYFFINPNACGMKLEVRTLATSELPGGTPLEALSNVYQRRYVGEGGGTWAITQEPVEVDLNGSPAARLEAERVHTNRASIYQITVVRGENRSAVVQGQIGSTSAEDPNRKASLNEMTDSVVIYDPAPVCYVGFKLGSDPEEYGVGCDDGITGATGPGVLEERGFSQIELGPVTWDECAAFMREHDQRYW